MEAVIFDLGGVLIDWNPRYLYKKLINDDEKMEWFLDNICTGTWNAEQDAGKPTSLATAEKVAEFPQYKEWIEAYYGRWIETVGGDIPETVELLKKLRKGGKYKIYALSNWSGEFFPLMVERFDFLKLFDGLVVSGYEKAKKPEPELYHIILDRYKLNPSECVFIDDSPNNLLTAQGLGIKTILFKSAGDLQLRLMEYGVSVN